MLRAMSRVIQIPPMNSIPSAARLRNGPGSASPQPRSRPPSGILRAVPGSASIGAAA